MDLTIPFEEVGLREQLGVILPAWFAAEVPAAQIETLLRETLAGSQRLCLPHHLVLVTDGCPLAAEVATRLQDEWEAESGAPFVLLALEANAGKGGAIAAGLRHLLTPAGPPYLLTRDSDGDHQVSDMARLFRLATQMAAEQQTDLVAVIGGRQSLHRPMGWLRGELEGWLDEVATAAWQFALARQGLVLDTAYWAAYGPLADIESGCKLFSAAAGRRAREGLEREHAAHPDLDLLRWGCELIPLTEVVLAGGVVGEMRRMTYEGQPVSGYEGADGVRLYANQFAWLARRLELTQVQAATLLDNALLRRPLWSEPRGRELALQIRAQVLETLPGPPAPEQIHASLFI
ncbi:MAG TPA: hypothetical protein VGM19_09695 [Armatimonadota bacterium]